MIAALYVLADGPYAGLDDVQVWDEKRDARTYAGPWPVVAHPPCERWGRYWGGGPMLQRTPKQKTLGDDGGCFKAALASVRRWGGVLEHPEGSHAWRKHFLALPPKAGGWIPADLFGGWTCCVEQGHYGHAARKATWLYAFGVELDWLPELIWGPAPKGQLIIEPDYHSKAEAKARRATRTGVCQRLSKRQRAVTPPAFQQVLLDMARSAHPYAVGVALRERAQRTPRKPLQDEEDTTTESE